MDRQRSTDTPATPGVDRRVFLRRGAALGVTAWAASLGTFMDRRAYGQTAATSPYGRPRPTRDRATGLELLQLPPGFSYISYGWTGDVMWDGVRTPALHDGMAVVDYVGRGRGDDDRDDDERRGNKLILVRNHEVGAGTPFTGDRKITYLGDGGGGTTNIVFNTRRGRFEKAWSSLAGTIRNCAGGVTPWGTWITSEETDVAGHGWNFDVGQRKGDPTPLKDMGRFSHEAVAVDYDTGVVYETEDAGDSGFYKFVPNVYGKLDRGGDLSMLRVKGKPNLDLGLAYPVGTTWDVEWVAIEDPEAVAVSCYRQGAAQGGARFRRLEGCWAGDGVIYFLSTDGGRVREGQVFEYRPGAETLKLIYDSPSYLECENPDNIVVTPRGGLLLCEDNAGAPPGPPNPGERLLGLTAEGRAYTFALNNIVLTRAYNDLVPAGDYRQNEWAGACYSPDGEWLFVNIQTPGVTFAITGPWERGTL